MTKSKDQGPTRRLRRFFSPFPVQQTGQSVFLDTAESHHLKHLLRLKEGDPCLVIDGSGQEAEACVKGFDASGKVELTVTNRTHFSKSESRLRLCFYVAIPQKGKMDEMVEKAQELGVEEIHPLETERTVVKMTASNAEKVVARWNKIAEQAAKQSGSLELVEIAKPLSLAAALAAMKSTDRVVLFHPDPDALPFGTWLQTLPSKGRLTLHLLIGPEGGFSDREVKAICEKKAEKISLGESLLKVDTAFLAVSAALKLRFCE